MLLVIKINNKLGVWLKLDTVKAIKLKINFLCFFICSSIKMNPKVRGTSKNSYIRAIKSKTVRLRKKVIKELKELIYKQKEKNKSWNTRKRVNLLGLKTIGKRQNLSKKNIEKVKQLNELTTYGLKTIAKLKEMKNYGNMTREKLIYTLLRLEKAPQENNYLTYLDNATDSDLHKRIKHARVLTAKLGNILTNKKTKTIRDELRRLGNDNLTRTETERAIAYLISKRPREETKIPQQCLPRSKLLWNKRHRAFV